MSEDLLVATSVGARYGTNRVLHDVNLSVGSASIVALIGHNGAGKTTFLRTVFGLHPILSGSVVFDGRRLASGRPRARTSLGIALVPQGGNIFPGMTVRDNLRIALESQRDRRDTVDRLLYVMDIFPVLKDRQGSSAGMLSGGQRQMLGVSLALVKRPRLLLLDEPSLGIAPNLVERLMKSLGGIRTTLATSIVLVDQAIRSAIDISDRVYVMRMGRIVLSGRSSEMGEDTDLWRYF